MSKSGADLIIDGIRFLTVGSGEARLIRTPGVWALVRRETTGARTVLACGWSAASAGLAAAGSSEWARALAQGMNEVAFTLGVRDGAELSRLHARVSGALEQGAVAA